MTVNTNGENFGFNIPHLNLGKLSDPPENPPCAFRWNGCFSGKQHSCYREPTHDGLHVCIVCKIAYIRERITQIMNEVKYIDP